MMQTLSRCAYGLILRAHPASFRNRFGGEMLWIFEAECGEVSSARLLCDALISLVRQRLKAHDEPDEPIEQICGPVSSALLVSDLKMSSVRLLQGAVMASLLFSGVAIAIERNGPLPVPFELQAEKCIPSSSKPRTMPRIVTIRDTQR